MGSFGERLRREREMRGITLEEISEATKITSRCLQALEEEKFDKLPGGIFNKGFVRSYAAFLGIDEDQAVADFVAASGGEKEQPLPDPPVARAVVLGQRAEDHFNWQALGVLVAVLAVASVVIWKLGLPAVDFVAAEWRAHSRSAPAASPEVASTAPAPPIAAPTPAAPPATAAAPEAASVAPQSLPEVAATPAPPPPPAPKKKEVVKAKQVAVAAKPVPTPAKAAAPPAPSRSNDFVVQIRATEDAWVQIVADGKLFSEGVLVPPAEKRVHAAKAVVIKTGNAAGVEVSFNGHSLPALGEENQMATVTLTSAGLQR